MISKKIVKKLVHAKFGSGKNIMHDFKNEGTFHTFNMDAISILNYKRKKQGQSKMCCYSHHLSATKFMLSPDPDSR